jgi:hypothetical protein
VYPANQRRLNHFEATNFVNALSQQTIKCVLLNARSVCNKLQELYHLLYGETVYDIIIITESWLNCKFPNSLIEPDGLYTVMRCDRSSKKLGGGVCVFVRKPLCTVEIALAEQYASLELCCFDFHLFGTVLRFINVYRSPSHNEMSLLIRCMQELVDVKSRPACIITGDFNCPGINWSQLTAPADGTQDSLLNFSIGNGLYQLVQAPTRGDAILDLIFSNEPFVIGNTCVKQPFSNSDHSQVDFTVFVDSNATNVSSNEEQNVRHFDWENANYGALNEYLTAVDWYGMLTVNLTADSLWNAFSDVLNAAIDCCVPIKCAPITTRPTKRRTRYPPAIRRAITRKLCLWRHHRAQPANYTITAAYRTASNRCKLLIRNYEIKRENKVIESNNAGSFYNFVNKKLACKKGVGALRDEQGNTVSNDEQRANMLNQYFSSVCTKDDGLSPPIAGAGPNDASINILLRLHRIKWPWQLNSLKVVSQAAQMVSRQCYLRRLRSLSLSRCRSFTLHLCQ